MFLARHIQALRKVHIERAALPESLAGQDDAFQEFAVLIVFDHKAGAVQMPEDDRPVGLPAELQPSALGQGFRVQRAGIVDESGVLIGPDRLAESLPSREPRDAREDIQRPL